MSKIKLAHRQQFSNKPPLIRVTPEQLSEMPTDKQLNILRSRIDHYFASKPIDDKLQQEINEVAQYKPNELQG